MATLYGIKNCDTCRKAMKLLEQAGFEPAFHDLRRDGVPGDRLADWLAGAGAAGLVNRRSATWRQLDAATRERADSDTLRVLRDHPTLIRRPVLEHDGRLLVGFDADAYRELTGESK